MSEKILTSDGSFIYANDIELCEITNNGWSGRDGAAIGDEITKRYNLYGELVRCLSNLVGHHDFVKVNFDTEYLFVDEAREALKKASEI